jgi:putative membrane protein
MKPLPMKKLVHTILIAVLSILILVWVFPHDVWVANSLTLILAGVVLAILELTLRPFLKLILLPINVLTLGIVGWLVNIFVLWLVQQLVPGFHIGQVSLWGMEFNQFWSLVIACLGLSIVGSILRIFI